MLVRVSRPRSTRHFSGLFLPQKGIVSMFFSDPPEGGLDLVTSKKGAMFSQAPGASRSQHRLSSFLLTKYGPHGCIALGCTNTNGHRPTNTRSCFSAPEAVLNEVEQRFDCVQAQTHMYPSLVGGFRPHPEPNSSPPCVDVFGRCCVLCY